MKKKLSASLLVGIVALMSVLLSPICHAKTKYSRAYVSGVFDYDYALLMDPINSNGKTYVFAEEWETWTGDLAGDGHAYFIVMVYESGLKEVVLLSTLTGEVNGKEGTLVIRLVGKRPADGEWFGYWVILSGTGELENVCGQGLWWGPGYEAPGNIPGERPDIYYTGFIRFRK